MTQKLDENQLLQLLELANIAEQNMRESNKILDHISRKMARKKQIFT